MYQVHNCCETIVRSLFINLARNSAVCVVQKTMMKKAQTMMMLYIFGLLVLLAFGPSYHIGMIHGRAYVLVSWHGNISEEKVWQLFPSEQQHQVLW